MRKARANHWIVVYTLFFIFGVFAWQLALIYDGKALIMSSDGVKQHFTVIGYIGQMVRRLFSGEGYRMVSLQLGQGFDTLTTLSYYGYTDPFCYLGIFASSNTLEIVYALTAFMRAYFSGIAFGVYERKVGVKAPYALAFSATTYVFSGYFILLMGRHPYFLNGALYLPLMLYAVERIFDERKWLMLTLVTAIMLVVNFYFAYMNTVATIIYIVVRLIVKLRDVGVKESFKDGVTLLGGYLLGAGLAAFVFLPIAMLYFNNSRLGIEAGYQWSMLHYPMAHLKRFFSSAFVPGINPSYYSRLGFLPLSLIGLLGLLGDRRRKVRQAVAGLVICFIVACIPFLGMLMNGMAYVSNRWIYVLALFICLCTGLGLQNIYKGQAKLTAIAVLALLYSTLLCVGLFVYREYKAIISCVLIDAHAISILFFAKSKRASLKKLYWVTGTILAISCCAYIMVEYLSVGYSRNSDLANRGVYQSVSSNTIASEIKDDAFYRVNQYKYDDPNSLLLDYSGTSFYWSLVNSDVSEYYRSLWLPTQSKPYQIYGLGGNTFMNEVASVKYYVQRGGGRWHRSFWL